MSDVFDDLGSGLHRAARRRVRRARVATAATVAAMAALLVAVVVPALSGEPEREVAAPVGACGTAQPPRELLDRYAVLRRAPTPEDIPPPPFDAGGAQVWSDAARMAREIDGHRFWIVPAMRGSCERPEPVVCLVIPGDAACHGAPGSVTFRSGGGWLTGAAVADGADPFLRADGRNVEGDVEGNVFVAREAGEVVLDRSTYEPAPLPDCGTAVSTRRPAPDVLIDQFAILRGDGPSGDLPGDLVIPFAARIFPNASRRIDSLGERYVLLPALLWTDDSCNRERSTPGLCLVEADESVICVPLAGIRRRELVLRDRDSAITILPDDIQPGNVLAGRP